MIPFDPERRARQPRADSPTRAHAVSAPDSLTMSWSAIKRRFETGVATRGRSLQERGAVQDLARTPDGGLVARVRADQLHIVNVGVVAGIVIADCTCEDDDDCRHAVAVLLEYQAQVARGIDVPAAPADDPRITGAEHRERFGAVADDDDEVTGPGTGLALPWLHDHDHDHDDEDDLDDDFESEQNGLPNDVRTYLRGLPSETLVGLIEQIAIGRPDVQDLLVNFYEDEQTATDDLIQAARETIGEIEAPGSYDEVEDLADDLERLVTRFRVLSNRDYADDVLDLYRELLVASTGAVQSLDGDDPEDTLLIEPLRVVLEGPFASLSTALDRSSLAPAARLLWLVDQQQTDQADLLSAPTFEYWQQDRPAEVWSEVADGLIARLARDDDALVAATWRDISFQQLAQALRLAGRDAELRSLLEAAAERSGNILLLVGHLIETGDFEDAERRLRAAIDDEATPLQIGMSLHREMLGKVYERQGDLQRLASFHADRFFRLPTAETYRALIEAARSLDLEAAVRPHALRYLETVQTPWRAQPRPGDDLPPWPLAELGLAEPELAIPVQAPMVDMLLEVFLEDGDVEAAFRWYERARGKTLPLEDEVGIVERIALLLEPSDPARAVSLLTERARVFLDRGRPDLLDDAAIMLERAGRIEQRRGRLPAWLQMLSGLRHRHRKQTRVRQRLDDVLAQFPSR